MLKLYRFSFTAMGCPCELRLYAIRFNEAKRAAKKAVSDIRRLEVRYSRYRADSITSEINRVARRGGHIGVDEETAQLLNYAHTCYEESDGLFDISSGILRKVWDFKSKKIPVQSDIAPLLEYVGWNKILWDKPRLEFVAPGMELDFGGIGKEYAADRAATICIENGIHHGLVDLGGDIQVMGPHPDGSPWHIGIRHPRQANALLAMINVYQGGIASSGDYERCIKIEGKHYSHILNPKTGWPVQGLSAVSVIADHCLVAGSVSTIGLLRGDAAIQWLSELGLQHIWMDNNGRVGGNLGWHPLKAGSPLGHREPY